MSLGFPTRCLREGAVTFLTPDIRRDEGEPLDHAISRVPVFYNPRMRLNRDTAVLALVVHQRRLSRPLTVCEPMCGTGVRGIRLAVEVAGVERVVLGDLNPASVRIAQDNAALNGVSERVRVRLLDANLLLSIHARPGRRLDYIDIDPYGSPAPYLDGAVRACRHGGMVALTATDMALLCGVHPEACLRKYGGLPLRTKYCHEVALRLVTAALVKASAKHDVAVYPLLSYASDHYVRLYAVLERGARKADRTMQKIGYLLHCQECLHRMTATAEELSISGRCRVCGSRMMAGGPMWLGELADRAFCDEMLIVSEESALSSHRQLMRIIRLVRDEAGFEPGFYNIDALCSKVGVASLPMDDVLSALGGAGFNVTRTHFHERGVKTDASTAEVENVLKELQGRAGQDS